MVSQNFIISMLAIAIVLLASALFLYASLMITAKEACLCTTVVRLGGQTTMAEGKIQTTTTAEGKPTTGIVITTAEPVKHMPCLEGYSRIDQSSSTCYQIFPLTDQLTPQSCSDLDDLAFFAKVGNTVENARVQAFIDSYDKRGFFYVSGLKITNNWVNSDFSTILFEKTFFDIGQFSGDGPYVFMKTKGNGFWYQGGGSENANEGYYFICQYP